MPPAAAVIGVPVDAAVLNAMPEQDIADALQTAFSPLEGRFVLPLDGGFVLLPLPRGRICLACWVCRFHGHELPPGQGRCGLW